MHFETRTFQNDYRSTFAPTKRVSVVFLVDGEQNQKTFHATAVTHNADGTLSVRTASSVTTYNSWVSFEESA